MVRYSEIREKNPREIVLLRGSGCRWRKCRFCDYHLDFSKDTEENYRINREILEKITGKYKSLEVINSGSFAELDPMTLDGIERICREKKILQLRFEAHWIYRKEIQPLRERFAAAGTEVKIKMGVETFDTEFRETIMAKGMGEALPREIARYADEVCLLFGFKGQTEESMERDIETGLAFFERICINLMNPNTAPLQPDPDVIRLFLKEIYPRYKDNPRADILLENTEFGVGGGA